MITTYFISNKELDAMKVYIQQMGKPWFISAKLMDGGDRYPDIIHWEVEVDGVMTPSEAFHMGLFVAKEVSMKNI